MFGGLGLLSSGGEGGRLTMLGLVLGPGSGLFSDSRISSSTRLGSSSTLLSPIFFNADWGGGNCGGAGNPWPCGTLIKMGFNLPPSSWGWGKVL